MGQLHERLRGNSIPIIGKTERETSTRDILVTGEDKEGIQGEDQVIEGAHGEQETGSRSHINEADRRGRETQERVRRQGSWGASRS